MRLGLSVHAPNKENYTSFSPSNFYHFHLNDAAAAASFDWKRKGKEKKSAISIAPSPSAQCLKPSVSSEEMKRDQKLVLLLPRRHHSAVPLHVKLN